MKRNQRIPLTRYADMYGITMLEALYHAYREGHPLYYADKGYCSLEAALDVFYNDGALLCVEVRNAA